MIIYVALFILMVLLRYSLQGRRKGRGQMYAILLVVLFVFSAFRFEVGCDWSGYLNQWNVQEYSTFEEALQNVEPTWWAMMQGLQFLGLPYPWLNVASSAVFFLGVHVLARRQPDPLGFLVLLFPILIINMPMSGIRQGAAIGIMCFAFAAFMDRRLFWFVAWTLLASSIHNSAIIFMLLPPLVGGKYSTKRLALAGLLALPGAFVLLSGDAAQVATSRYIDSGVDAAGSAFRVGLLVLTGLGYFFILRKAWKFSFPHDYKLATIGALMMGAMIGLVPLSTVIGDRLGYYMIPIQTMILARIPYLPIRKSRALYAAVPYLALGLVFLVWTSLSWHFDQCYVPYQTWIFGFPTSAGYFY
ncbi:MAG: EpsG family protein [Rhizobiaceae bacterium]|nr:EpsG family protein [Rhizobiaceae bacterium]